jgi:hypothetical protein
MFYGRLVLERKAKSVRIVFIVGYLSVSLADSMYSSYVMWHPDVLNILNIVYFSLVTFRYH